MKGWLKCVVLFPFALDITSCGLFKRIPDEVHHRDSTIISYKDSTVIKDSLVYISVPQEESQNILPKEQFSYLHTSLAESTAFVDTLGFLHHSLKNRSNEKLPVIVQNLEKYAIAKSEMSKSDTIIRTVQVEKKLTWWQRFRIKSFWFLAAILTIENILLIFAIRKRFIFK